MVYEVAIKDLTHRHILKDSAELPEWAWENGEKQALYNSVYCYSPDDRQYMEGKKASDWLGFERHIEWVPIDVDRKDNSAEQTIRNAAFILNKLYDLGLTNDNLKIYFSGRGYHFMIHAGCFNFMDVLNRNNSIKPGERFLDLPWVVKETMMRLPEIGKMLDDAIYQRNGFFRTSYSLNLKSNLYKIPLHASELLSLDHQKIEQLAATRREDFPFLDLYTGDGELEQYVVTQIPQVRTYSTVKESSCARMCINKIMREGPIVGKRHHAILRLASHMRDPADFPLEDAKRQILEWNQGSMDETIVQQIVEDTYKRQYNYGCTDKVLKEYCSTRCRHYPRKDMIQTPDTFDELIAKAKSIDFLSEFQNGIDLAHMFGISMGDETDFILTRGELISVIGETKAGKSTLGKHVALGLDLTDPSKFYEKYRRPSIYYTGEETPPYWLLSCCMILENCSKNEMLHRQNELIDKWLPHLKHVMPLPTTSKISGIREHIEKYRPEQIFLDTLDHFVDKSKGAVGIEQAMLELQDICTEYNVTIWNIAQIKRLDSIEGTLSLFSGKGSGSIENQSRKVIGLANVKNKARVRKVVFLANSYGGAGQEAEYMMLSSMRLMKV
jgi:hypothetical protein